MGRTLQHMSTPNTRLARTVPGHVPMGTTPFRDFTNVKRLSQKRTYVLFGRYYLVVFVLQPFWQKLAQLRNSWQSSEFPSPCGAQSSESRRVSPLIQCRRACLHMHV
ncbi:hypothetical protein KIL84_022802 [Mauremys mutica]|uniref:Uncharacterized protein n=1 Tax=Mauremys mutica TaxID=74926 RepID=A0A9D3WRG5_9SAUR|nr:hypothetical protein KIL84_022802 [Mauremys mutica]